LRRDERIANPEERGHGLAATRPGVKSAILAVSATSDLSQKTYCIGKFFAELSIARQCPVGYGIIQKFSSLNHDEKRFAVVHPNLLLRSNYQSCSID
jgi:hypothetical protein